MSAPSALASRLRGPPWPPPRGALGGAPVAAAARRAERDRVALVHDVLLLGIGLLAVDAQFARRAVPAAFDAERGEEGPFCKDRPSDRRVAATFDQDLRAESAAMAAGAARIGPQL